MASSQSSQVSADVNASTNAKTEDKITDGKYSSHSIDEVAGMIRNTISAYEVKVTTMSRTLSVGDITFTSSDNKLLFRL